MQVVGSARGMLEVCVRDAEGMRGIGRGCVQVRRAGISNIVPVFAMFFT